MSAYAELKTRRATIANLEHLQSVASWDRMVNMPPHGAKMRAAAQGELEVLVTNLQTDPAVGPLLTAADAETLDADDAANLALMRHEQRVARAVSEALVRRRAELIGAANQAWMKARGTNDWSVFAEVLAPLVACVWERAERLGEALELAPYDALLDEYDRGATLASVSAQFGAIAAWLPDMIARIRDRQAGDEVLMPTGPFPIDGQKRVGIAVMTMLGFDFDGGRLDISAHPFMSGSRGDIRITTRYREEEFFQSLFGIVHETGHAMYQSNLPLAWQGQPLGNPSSMAVHESQSLTFERVIGPSAAFVTALSPLLVAEFGDQAAFAPDNLLRVMTRVRPGAIRVEADEVTYPAHILLRTEIEPKLLTGELPVADLPAWWEERMQTLLGVDVRGDHTRGALQDVHWSMGMFGYFPTYLRGSMIAAQLDAAFRAAHPQAEMQPLAEGLAARRGWLDANVWSQGARLSTDALVERATGKPLGSDALKAHFERRYLGGAA